MNKTAALLGLLLALTATAWATTPEEAKLIANVAERGNDGAQVLLALIYLDGEAGFPKDERRAAYWFERAATQGNAYAQARLGDLYAAGKGVARDLREARLWREKAAHQNNARAQAKLGEMYLNGDGVARDYAQAEYWLAKAADQGEAHAQYLLGQMYYAGYGVPENLERGKHWLERAAAQGHSEALKLLNFVVEIGREALQVYYQRGDILKERAEGGNVEAQYQLGLRYETGAWGVSQDNAKALYWLNQAANQGHKGAMVSLAHIHRDGLLGVKPDAGEAAMWEQRAHQAPR